MVNRSMLGISLLLITSVMGYGQYNPYRSISVSVGIWKGYNTIMHQPVNFTVNGVGMGGFTVNYEQKFKKLTYGITADFADINYVTQYTKDRSFDTGNAVGIGRGREELAASNIVINLGTSVKYNIFTYNSYSFNLIASPRLGLLIYNKFYDDIDGNLNNRNPDKGASFYLYNSIKQCKWPVPLIKLTIENEFRLSKKSGLLLSIGYQKGFIPVFTTKRTYVSNYNTPDEIRENIEVKTRATNLSLLLGYRYFF